MARGIPIVVVVLAAVVACQSAANLQVTYTDAGARSTGPQQSGAHEDADDSGVPEPIPPAPDAAPPSPDEGSRCPCTTGLACCVTARAEPFCTASRERCAELNGGFYGCVAPTTETACCWGPPSALPITASGSVSCDGRPVACTEDAHCPGTAAGRCHLATCGTFTVGACGDELPACPPGL